MIKVQPLPVWGSNRGGEAGMWEGIALIMLGSNEPWWGVLEMCREGHVMRWVVETSFFLPFNVMLL